MLNSQYQQTGTAAENVCRRNLCVMVAKSPGLCASEAAVTPFTGKGASLLTPGQVSWMGHGQHFLMTPTYKPESGSISQPQPWDRTAGPAAAQSKAWILVPSGSTPAE
ncbi:unnamed protein product [Rangifer tarandus platyrhynchus]|uniref:Uncharacterized protein n=1 Tax=Rangifer tarandus platyrhynchus TaxID=3082113 RepID=A0AC59ZJL1_RANTA